jgi:hypothetical protein
MEKKPIMLAAALIALFALPALAQVASTPRIDERQAEQQRRIEEGIRSGQINRKEAAHLRRQQARIQRMENQAMADGRMSRAERIRIEHAQNKESLRIAKQKHNLHTAGR